MKIRKHKQLNPDIWEKNKLLKQPVSDLLMRIVSSYLESIRNIQHLDIDNSDVKDIFIYGSCVNYFYTKKSDIDMCIVIDFDSVKKKNPDATVNLRTFKLYYYNWMMTHRVKIYGRKTDISIQDPKKFFYGDRYRSGPAFSVMKNEWIYEPVIVSDQEFRQIQKQARIVYKKIMHDFKCVKRDGFTMADTKRIYANIYASKNATHHAHVEQPVTYMYLAFRKLRDRGVLSKLRDRMIELESKEFVLK